MNTAIEIYNQIFSLCLPDFPPEQKQNENHKCRVVFTEKSQTQSDLTVHWFVLWSALHVLTDQRPIAIMEELGRI